jgi:hypothetical protein
MQTRLAFLTSSVAACFTKSKHYGVQEDRNKTFKGYKGEGKKKGKRNDSVMLK